METAYTVQEVNNEVIFAKDEESISEQHEELCGVIYEALGYNDSDTEFYANWLINRCKQHLQEPYNKDYLNKLSAKLIKENSFFKNSMEVKHE